MASVEKCRQIQIEHPRFFDGPGCVDPHKTKIVTGIQDLYANYPLNRETCVTRKGYKTYADHLWHECTTFKWHWNAVKMANFGFKWPFIMRNLIYTPSFIRENDIERVPHAYIKNICHICLICMYDLEMTLKCLIWLQITFYRNLIHRNEFFIPENGIKHVSHVLVINHAIYVWYVYKSPWNDLKMTEYGIKWPFIMICYTELISLFPKMV